MVCQIGMGYGVWESLVHLAGNRLGGHEKVWVMGGYGLLEVWVKTEATVCNQGHIQIWSSVAPSADSKLHLLYIMGYSAT
jgi:hypothetical protein